MPTRTRAHPVYDTTKYQGQSGWFTVGGTSLAAPLIAGVYGLAGGGSGTYPAALPYAHQSDLPAALHDVTSGSNGSCGKLDDVQGGGRLRRADRRRDAERARRLRRPGDG
jgi:hypothetical protein